jgi:hypothetical protein
MRDCICGAQDPLQETKAKLWTPFPPAMTLTCSEIIYIYINILMETKCPVSHSFAATNPQIKR